MGRLGMGRVGFGPSCPAPLLLTCNHSGPRCIKLFEGTDQVSAYVNAKQLNQINPNLPRVLAAQLLLYSWLCKLEQFIYYLALSRCIAICLLC